MQNCWGYSAEILKAARILLCDHDFEKNKTKKQLAFSHISVVTTRFLWVLETPVVLLCPGDSYILVTKIVHDSDSPFFEPRSFVLQILCFFELPWSSGKLA